MPFNALIRVGGVAAHALPVNSPIRCVIVHYDPPSGPAGGRLRSVTLDFEKKADLSKVWEDGVKRWAADKRLLNTDDHGIPIGYHLVIHGDMTQVLRCDLRTTLTDNHQHWCDAGTETLAGDHLGRLLQILREKRYLRGANEQHLINNVAV